MQAYDQAIKDILDQRLLRLIELFDGEVIFFYGAIHEAVIKFFRDQLEQLKASQSHSRLVMFLNTMGGSAETVEKLVEIIRHHYAEVFFVVPDFALSAGTIFSMSGNRIYMDYSSSLGPIDPQVYNGQRYVPALGYLDQVEKLIEKSIAGTISGVEYSMLQNLDLAELNQYEQQRNLTVTLLKKWLVEYKFQDWLVHRSSPEKVGKPVTQQDKQDRAEEIARKLGDNRLWHSHNRFIGMHTLIRELKLEITDFGQDTDLCPAIRDYNDSIVQHIARTQLQFALHTRLLF